MQQSKIAFFEVIRVIEQASKEELKAIAGVEKAIINQATDVSRKRISPRTGRQRPSNQEQGLPAGGDFVQTNNTNLDESTPEATAHALSRTEHRIDVFDGSEQQLNEVAEAATSENKESIDKKLHVSLDPNLTHKEQVNTAVTNTVNNSKNTHNEGDTHQHSSSINTTIPTEESAKNAALSSSSNVNTFPTELNQKEEQHFTQQEQSNYTQEKLATSNLSIQKENNKLLQGIYRDSNGILRQSNGAFATRKQKEEKAKSDREKMAGQGGIIAQLANWGIEKTKSSGDNQAVDTAGVAIGSSAWIAATEIANTASEARDFLVENNLNSTDGIKENLQKGKTNLSNPLGMIKNYFSSKEEDVQRVSTSEVANQSRTQKVQDTTTNTSRTIDEASLLTVNDSTLSEPKSTKENKLSTDNKLTNFQNASSPQSTSVTKAVGSLNKTGSFTAKPTAHHEVQNTFTESQLREASIDSKRHLNKSTSYSTNATSISDSNTAEVKRKETNSVDETAESIDEQTVAINTTSAQQLDVLERMYKAIASQSNSGTGFGSGLFGEDGVDLDSKKEGAKKKRGRHSRKPKPKINRLPSVLSTSGDLASTVLSKSGSLAGTAVSGASAALKGVGKFVPLLAPALMAYDAFTGFTDAEKQQEVFNLKKGQEATLGQKSSMALASVLDMGGLISGSAGLIGDGLGKLGFDGAKEALNFDSGSMAKGIYSIFSSESTDEEKQISTNKQSPEEQLQTKHEDLNVKSNNDLDNTNKFHEATSIQASLEHKNSTIQADSIPLNEDHATSNKPPYSVGTSQSINEAISQQMDADSTLTPLSSRTEQAIVVESEMPSHTQLGVASPKTQQEINTSNDVTASPSVSPFNNSITDSSISKTSAQNAMFSHSSIDNSKAYSTGDDADKQSEQPKSLKDKEEQTIIVQHDPKLNKTLDELLKVTKENQRDKSTVIRYSSTNQSNNYNNTAQNKGGTGEINLTPTNTNLQVIAMDAE